MSMIEPMPLGERTERLKQAVQSAKPGVCTDRAVLWTEYFRKRSNRSKPTMIQMAEAMSHFLGNKRIAIYPDELIVGNFTSKRVGGSIYPELHGVTMLEDLFKFSGRDTNPLDISGKEKRQLLAIAPFWLTKFLAFKTFRSPLKKMAFIYDQLGAYFYLINELGGVAHLAPDYEKLIRVGLRGYIQEAEQGQAGLDPNSQAWLTLEGMKIIAQSMISFGARYAALAQEMAADEPDPARKAELEQISEVCSRVPGHGAATLQEALQSILLMQIAINLESLDNGICPGRMDQYLYPYYEADLKAGRITQSQAKDLLAAFCIKLSEIIPIFSARVTRFHGGMFNGQVITIGGVDAAGNDAANDLSLMFLEVIDQLRMRQPNFHARMHPGASESYVEAIYSTLAKGGNSPALYNDTVIEAAMGRAGYSQADARNYTAVGCVEPVCQGKSFSSTDAALVNVPILLEMALNQGRRFGKLGRAGAKTPPVDAMQTMDDVTAAFEAQLTHRLQKLVGDLQAVEIANATHHPTPLTSLMLDGCLENATCSTAGGASYNFSGVQCVGPADTGDALYAIEKSVFIDKRWTLSSLVDQLKADLEDSEHLAYLRGLAKFGNDIEEVDRWTRYVVEAFANILGSHENTRHGKYTTGLYSVTAHQYFGSITGAMAHGRKKGESLASGLAPVNGMDQSGPTALLNSINRLDFTQLANGINFNLKFDSLCLRGDTGVKALGYIMKTYFSRGGMQVQVNVLDPQVLIEARDHPEMHPHLLVRVSGYSAYFNDLTPDMKEELIQRTNLAA